MTTGKMRNALIPAATVEASGVAKEDGRVLAGPFPKGDLKSVYGESMFSGHFYQL
jgi:hypothetical protein